VSRQVKGRGKLADDRPVRSSAQTVLLFFALLPLFVLPAQQDNLPDVGAYVDWAEGRVVLVLSLPTSERLTARARFDAERVMELFAPDALMNAVSTLLVDSWQDVEGYLAESPKLMADLRRVSMNGRKANSFLSPDLREVNVEYEFPLFGSDGIATLFFEHQRAFPLDRVLGAVPTTRYTGLVIYAAEAVPAIGYDEDRLPRPCLFPRIYDQEMKLVLEREMCEPESLRRWGMVAYSGDLDYARRLERVGAGPMTVMARGVFGRNSTDLIIPTESARRLLASPSARQALREGRILVIYRDPIEQLSSTHDPTLRAEPTNSR
jgi:hypothetical protein